MIGDAELEQAFLHCLIKREFRTNLRSLPMDLFSDSANALLGSALQQFVVKFHGVPTEGDFTQFVQDGEWDKKEKTKILRAYSEVLAADAEIENYEFYRKRLEDLRAGRHLFKVGKTIEEGIGANRGFSELRSKVMQEMLTGGLPLDQIQWKGFIWEDVIEQWEAFQRREKGLEATGAVPWGIEFLDRSTGGLFPGTISLLYSGTGVGKSRTMISTSYNITKANFTLMYFSLEMAHDLMKRCFYSRAAMVDSVGIRDGKLSEKARARLRAAMAQVKKEKPPFYLVDLPEQATVDHLYEEVEAFRIRTGAVPDVVVIDYAGIMVPVQKSKDRSEKYQILFQEIHNFARYTGTRVLTAVQESREGTKKLLGKDADHAASEGVEHIGMSNYIAPYCFSVVHLQQTKEDLLDNMLRMVVEKDREGKKFAAEHVKFLPANNFVGDLKFRIGIKDSQIKKAA